MLLYTYYPASNDLRAMEDAQWKGKCAMEIFIYWSLVFYLINVYI